MSEQEYAKLVAKNLRRIAYDNGKTQADIARDLKLSKATVSSWMNGTRIPRIDKIDLLCHYFNCRRVDIMEEHSDAVQDSRHQDGYYLDDETVELARKILTDPDYRILYSFAKDSKREDVRMVTDILRRFKEDARDD